jgi:5'-nucleotidase
MTATVEKTSKVNLLPLYWQNGKLVGMGAFEETNEVFPEVTILHTNDFHSSNDGRTGNGRPGGEGVISGGISRIATTIKRAKAAGPTLALDAGDSVYGFGTWWDAKGSATTAKLRGAAGYDLAAIGNHDMEHGLAGLKELFEGNYPFVAANLTFTHDDISERVRPAYIAQVGGWRIGITGVTTPDTLHLIPSRMLDGMTLTDPLEALTHTIAVLEPMVDTIIIVSHLGFQGHGMGDRELAPKLAGTKVSVILGGHTHEALDPAPIISGILVCNAGAYGANINEVKLFRGQSGAIEIRARLLPQDETIAADPVVEEVRLELAEAFTAYQNTIFTIPELPELEGAVKIKYGEHDFSKDREWVLLARALREAGNIEPDAILMVAILYVLGQLPTDKEKISLAELVTVYPNIERLVEVEISGADLKELILFQPSLVFYQQAQPVLLSEESLVKPEQLEDETTYKLIVTELLAEGGLGWKPFPAVAKSTRVLEYTCLEVITDYLKSL